MNRFRDLRSFVLLAALLGLAILGRASAGAAHDQSQAGTAGFGGDGPRLTGAVSVVEDQGDVAVSGEAFTAGGAVYVAIYDVWGTALHETRSTTADPAVFGMNGSADPALGFRPGGTLSEAFADLRGATAMVRAYDQESARWSNWLDIAPAAVGLATSGPNGSQDPAFGFAVGSATFGPNGSTDPALGFDPDR